MSLRDRYAKLEPRERRLLNVLIGLFAVVVLLLLPASVVSMVSSRRDDNQEIRDLIASINESRSTIAERKMRHEALLARYAKPAPALAGFIEEAARANGLASPESQDRPDIPHGKRYTERLTIAKLHKVSMLPVAKMLEKIEQSGYPVAITKLNIKPRAGEPDSYEVEIGVSAYDRKEPPKEKEGGPATTASAAAGEAP